MLVQERLYTQDNLHTPKRLYTVDEFEQLLYLPENQDRLLELINGEIIEKMPTEEHGVIATNVVFALKLATREQKLGRVGVEVRYRKLRDKLNSRMPDVSFTTLHRPMVRVGSVPHLPDLAIEIQSPTDSVKKMREKATYYLANGSRLVWLIYPRKRLIEVYRLDGDEEILGESDVLTAEEVLPGFSMPVSEVFADPFEE